MCEYNILLGAVISLSKIESMAISLYPSLSQPTIIEYRILLQTKFFMSYSLQKYKLCLIKYEKVVLL